MNIENYNMDTIDILSIVLSQSMWEKWNNKEMLKDSSKNKVNLFNFSLRATWSFQISLDHGCISDSQLGAS